MARREKKRDDRDFDTTQLRESGHGRVLARDYSAHFFRWSFARRFVNSSTSLLDIGCGQDKPLTRILTGGPLSYIGRYVGVDLNPVKASADKRLTFHGEFNFVERWKELKPAAPFDVVLHYEVIEHMLPCHGVDLLKGCRELLKVGGIMLMSTPCYDGKRHAANHIHEYTVPELREVVEMLGFRVEARYGTFMDVKYLKKPPHSKDIVEPVLERLRPYFDDHALSCFFAPMFPDHSRNNLWVCRRVK